MIRKISYISNFGVFDEFNWDTAVRDKGNNITTFKKFNIIYGRNYSGKTSLSRIFRSLEKKQLPLKYPELKFEISCDDKNISQSNITKYNLNIRVYNEDFVKEYLRFLIDEQGEIQPFAVLGERNVEIEKQIKEKKEELGDVERKRGLRYELFSAKSDYDKKKREREQAKNNLDSKLRNKANRDIKENSLYGDVRYNISKIKNDINRVLANRTKYNFSEEKRDKKLNLLREEVKENINFTFSFALNLDRLFLETKQLLNISIKPSKIIEELIMNSSLQEWVRLGIPHHKGKRNTCAFCGNLLHDDLWDKLDAHFNKESEELRISIEQHIEILKREKINIKHILKVTKEQFYSFHQSFFEELKTKLEKEISIYNKSIDTLIKILNKRLGDIFKTRNSPSIEINSNKIQEFTKNIHELILKHNQKASTLHQDQIKAKVELRLNDICRFINDIDYEKETRNIEGLTKDEKKIKEKYLSLEQQVKTIERDIKELRSQLRDERRGAEKINEYLNHFFGNERLKFHAVEDEEIGFRFKIHRNSELAFNLSEGERSLIALCYFVAKLEDVGTSGKELIVWIDDPVSSLDNNHIFFAHSLIENAICKKISNSDGTTAWKYNQLFISTHNLEFLKYLKRLSKPKNDNQYFILERAGNKSVLKLMPDYLKNYITEFNYLFHQIYLCAHAGIDDNNYELFYNFGNNLRKFIEAYLFYKYPYHTNDKLAKLRKFFGDDAQSVDVTNRLTNELSHLEEIFDRSLKPLEIPEISKLAMYILEKIKEKDLEQYNALLKSIGVNSDKQIRT